MYILLYIGSSPLMYHYMYSSVLYLSLFIFFLYGYQKYWKNSARLGHSLSIFTNKRFYILNWIIYSIEKNLKKKNNSFSAVNKNSNFSFGHLPFYLLHLELLLHFFCTRTNCSVYLDGCEISSVKTNCINQRTIPAERKI